jgi:two-component sensor histidine kinase
MLNRHGDGGFKTQSYQDAAPQEILSSLVMREFRHRMANTLTVLHSSLRQQLATHSDRTLQEVLRRHEKQTMAVADLHRFFARDIGDGEILIESYFQSLCELLSRSVLAPLGLRCETFIINSFLSVEKCELLGLVVSELVMNAAKHAFPEEARGHVRIEIGVCKAYWRCLVSDDGIGMQKRSPGCGSDIIDKLIHALGARSAIQSGADGTAVSIVFAC